MAGGVRSFLAQWIGGASSPPAAGKQGYRSLFAFWAGGASAVSSAVAKQGYRSLFAFWAGGAASNGLGGKGFDAAVHAKSRHRHGMNLR